MPCVLASESRLCQVFINLLVNAAQAMVNREVEGREIRVKTRHNEAANLVGIDIADNGAGISAEGLARIFEPFYTTKDVGQGVGLGLALAYGIVQEHGGRISAANHPHGGAVFTVELPIA